MDINSENIIGGYETKHSFKDLYHLKLKEILIIKKYVKLLDKIRNFPFEDRYFFLSDLAIAEDIVGTSTEPLIKGRMHDEFIDKAIEETKKLEEKLKKYEENGISEFERKKKEIELKKIRINDESESKKNLSIEERLTLSLKKVYKAKLELNKCLEEYTNND